MNLLLIAIGGAVGSAVRYLFSQAVQRASGTLFPVGTLAVNFAGCLVFGFVAGAAEQRVHLAPELRMFLLVGILGGFTTFSSYAFESLSLMRDGQWLAAAVNVAGQAIAGIAGVWLGFAMTR